MKVIHDIKMLLIRGIISFAGVFPKKREVLFSSFDGKQYSDSPRAISEKLRELYPEFTQIWVCNDVNKMSDILPSYVKCVKNNSVNYYWILGKTYCFVTTEALPQFFRKTKNQFVIQTWHGDRAFKKVLCDCWPNGKRPQPVMDEFYTDLAIAASDYGEKTYRTAFKYKGHVLKEGMPRNDKLVYIDNESIKRIKKCLRIDIDTKVLLYAPTFRDSSIKSTQQCDIDLNAILKILEKNGDKWICLIRGHSLAKGLSVSDNPEFVDVSNYPDMSELLLVTDYLITDYSSSICDFVLTNRPSALACFDIDDYIKSDRDFKINPLDVGFFVARNQNELERIVEQKTIDDYLNCYQIVNKAYGTVESGKSSERICELISSNYPSI